MTSPTKWTVQHRDQVWNTVGDESFEARIYEPTGDGAPTSGRPAVVEVHGGAWSHQNRKHGRRYCEAMATAGIVVVAIDFRMGPNHQHPAATDDVAAAVAWTRSNADELGIDPGRVALVGSSSGGHLAFLSSLTLDEPVVGVIPLWPPLDPLARYRYAQNKNDDHGKGLVASTESYFATTEAMKQASVARVVAADEHTNLPPVWLVQPEEDANVPRPIIEEIEQTYRNAGGQIEIWWVPGQPHAFGHNDIPEADQMNDRMLAVLDGWFNRPRPRDSSELRA